MKRLLPCLSLWMLVFSTSLHAVEDRDLWNRSLKKVMMSPPCCGACARISPREGKLLWERITQGPSADLKVRETQEWLWKEHGKKIEKEFKTLKEGA